ncbi:glycosyltransferase [Candidatus Shapirobacteria bacterium]|nr:glycosyltransferase [Candidatus Shapirobacteria bacterium]
MPKTIKFTVAICTRNRPRFASKLLKQLSVQTTVPTQYLFIENTTENQYFSHKKLNKILKHTQVDYVTTKGQNLAVSRNLCLKLSKYNQLIILDDDILLKPDTFTKIILSFQKYPKATGFTTRTIHHRLGNYSTFTNYWYNCGYLDTTAPTISEFTPTTVLALDVAKLKQYQIHFNENISHAEDMDFFCQIKEKNLTLYYLPNIVALHFFGERFGFYEYLNRFYEWGYNICSLKKIYLSMLGINQLVPPTKYHPLLSPLFCIKKTFIATYNFKKYNQSLPVRLLPLAILAFYSYILGIYQATKLKDFYSN